MSRTFRPSGGAVRAAGSAAGNLPALRRHNDALVLELVRAAGPAGVSRGELAEAAGLTPQAVSKITGRLAAAGLLAEAGRTSTGGKPRTALRLEPGARHAVGLHLDRDELTAVLVDLTGAVVTERAAPLDLGAGAEAVVEQAAGVVRALVRDTLAGGTSGSGAGRSGGAGSRAGCPHTQTGDARARTSGEGARASGEGARPDGEGARPGSAEARPDDAEARPGSAEAQPGSAEAQPGGAGAPAGNAGMPTSHAGMPAGAPVTGPGTAVGASAAPGLPWPHSLAGVGVALPGPLDHASGVLGRVTGLPVWDGFPLRDVLADRLAGPPVVLDKDTNAAALALTRTTAGSFAYLHLATGLGAGLVLDGAVYRGPRTGAGEFGHQVVQLDGPRCECGRRGCLEAVCLGAVARGDAREAARVLGVLSRR
ncbi:ROK family protein, partial [Streptomyces coryli]|uniref:ROK family protein n=1 Tax=Streptomyces coryli TaxID=1128680 RepID=UPI0030B90107